MKPDPIRPGKPRQNVYIESFNGARRNKCLNEHWFIRMANPRHLIEEWRLDYNEKRPHSSLNDKHPAEFAQNQNLPDLDSAPTSYGWPILAEPR